MSNPARLSLALLSLTLCAATLQATSYVPMTDAALADQSPLIIQGKVEALSSDVAGSLPVTDYTVQVEQVLKGYAPGSTLIVRVPGGVRPDGIGLKLFGAPAFAQGETTILFLSRAKDSSYRIMQFMLGAFHRVRDGNRWDAVRDLSAVHAVGVANGTTSSPTVRDFARFARWLQDRALGSSRAADYTVPTSANHLKSLIEPFVLMTSSGCPQTLPLRWFVFDGGGSESFETVGQVAGMSDGGITEFQEALAAWTNDANSDIRYSYGGTTASDTGFSGSGDNQNAIKFDDPDNEIPNSFNCTQGGTLAIGGPWYSCSVQQYLGTSYHPILEGDIVTQDGAGCFFSGHGGADGAEVFTHELGHTLGLGHSTVSGAIMRAYAYGDGRGASLGTDDRDAIQCLYGDGTTCAAPSTSPPSAPSGLSATAISASSISLTWLDNSSNESSFKIERRTATTSFVQVASVGSNVTSTIAGGLAAQTTYTFRVRACNSAGCSTYTNDASATTSSSTTSTSLVAPSNLQATDINDSQIALSWTNNDATQQNVAIEESNGTFGSFTQVALLAGTSNSWTATGLAPGTSYEFRVRGQSGSAMSPYSNLSSATTAVNACGDPNALCLLQGRFAVTVHWVDYVNNRSGDGTPLPRTDQSGLFWFFGPNNFELAVKMIDGRKLNGHFWVFYGALTNVEYDLTVLDRDTGEKRVYHNPWKTICGGADAAAFPLAPASTSTGGLTSRASSSTALPVLPPATSAPGASGSCVSDSTTLCLQQGRFSVKVSFIDPNTNQQGEGVAIPQNDESGLFWFFSPGNFELAVKMIDGRKLNGHFWFFYGALSTVHYEITVTDTVTGLSHTFINQHGQICGGAETGLF